MEADEWFQGKDAPPILISLKEGFTTTTKAKEFKVHKSLMKTTSASVGSHQESSEVRQKGPNTGLSRVFKAVSAKLVICARSTRFCCFDPQLCSTISSVAFLCISTLERNFLRMEIL